MTKYIPAVKVVDHFNRTIADQIHVHSEYFANYQDALDEATRRAIVKRNEPAISRIDGLKYEDKKVTPIVLKEVLMVEQD